MLHCTFLFFTFINLAARHQGQWQPESLVLTFSSMYSQGADIWGAGNLKGYNAPSAGGPILQLWTCPIKWRPNSFSKSERAQIGGTQKRAQRKTRRRFYLLWFWRFGFGVHFFGLAQIFNHCLFEPRDFWILPVWAPADCRMTTWHKYVAVVNPNNVAAGNP